MNTRQARKARTLAQVRVLQRENRRKVDELAAVLHSNCPSCTGSGLVAYGNDVQDCPTMEHHWAVIALQGLAIKALNN